MTVRAALLDEKGVYQRMDELADAKALTALHLAQITACDLPAGEYLWIADDKNSMGGAFWPASWLASREADRQAVLQAQEKIAELQRIRALPTDQRRAARASARAARAAVQAAKAGG